jgi:hypothetical protein
MSDTIISLSPTMTRRLNFQHDLMNDVDDYTLEDEEVMPIIKRTIAGDAAARDTLILGFMWLAKDVVCRYRAHFPETRRFTDDMCSVGLEALTEFVSNLEQPAQFYNRAQAFINDRIRDFINDNRSVCSASRATNYRLKTADEPLEYHFAETFYEDAHGEDDYAPGFVDILDAIECLKEADKEEMHTLITMFLRQNHNIDEASLTDDERSAIEKLSEIGASL